jgi:hypothetical protein
MWRLNLESKSLTLLLPLLDSFRCDEPHHLCAQPSYLNNQNANGLGPIEYESLQRNPNAKPSVDRCTFHMSNSQLIMNWDVH